MRPPAVIPGAAQRRHGRLLPVIHGAARRRPGRLLPVIPGAAQRRPGIHGGGRWRQDFSAPSGAVWIPDNRCAVSGMTDSLAEHTRWSPIRAPGRARRRLSAWECRPTSVAVLAMEAPAVGRQSLAALGRARRRLSAWECRPTSVAVLAMEAPAVGRQSLAALGRAHTGWWSWIRARFSASACRRPRASALPQSRGAGSTPAGGG
jgi:hypothetical protein